jgi:hydroxymethylpyrimidine/phosphomethylpyrimidine kinase
VPLVVDPVMVAKGGHRLLLSDAEAALRHRLLPMAALLTPNLPEAEVLVGFPVRVEADMKRAAAKLSELGARAVLMKGGHLEGDRVVDLLFHDGRYDRFEDARIPSRNTHGTGCTLASAIAAGLAQKISLKDAVARARTYVRQAIETAPGFGRGHGPLNHAVTVRSD